MASSTTPSRPARVTEKTAWLVAVFSILAKTRSPQPCGCTHSLKNTLSCISSNGIRSETLCTFSTSRNSTIGVKGFSLIYFEK